MYKHISQILNKRLSSNTLKDAIYVDEHEHLLVQPHSIYTILEILKNDSDLAFDLLLDLYCIEHDKTSKNNWNHAGETTAYEVVYHVKSSRFKLRATLSVIIDNNTIYLPSCSSLFKSASWLERELWEMYGIFVEGHQTLKPLLLYYGFASHPNLKDYPKSKIQPIIPAF